MKKTFTYSAAIFSSLLLFQSCKKESPLDPQPINQGVTALVAAGQTYNFTPAAAGTLSLSRQAAHYQVSEVEAAKDNGYGSYKYSPAAGYTGADEVTLTLINTAAASDNNGGCNQGNHHNNSTTSITYVIKINVTN